MKIQMLASAPDGLDYHYLTTFLINNTVAIDAGCLGFSKGPEEQARVGHVFLSHSHADHVCSLPMFLNNVYDRREESVVVHAHPQVLDSLQTDVFNDRLWPNVLRLSDRKGPVVRFQAVEPGQAIDVAGLRVTAIPVSHVVPTFGYIVDDGTSAVVFSSDSRETDELWRTAALLPHLKAAFIGVAFPDEEAQLAAKAGHLTPRSLKREAAKLPADVHILAVHIKPSHAAMVVGQLGALDLPNLGIGCSGQEYFYGVRSSCSQSPPSTP